MRKLTTLIAANRKVAAGVAIGVVAVLAFILGYFAWRSKQEGDAASLLFKAVGQLTSDAGTAEGVKNQEDGVRLLREVTTRYPRTAAGTEATLRLATLFYTLGNYDEARTIYQGYLAKNPRGWIAFSVSIGVGDTYLAQGKYDKAVETYSKLIDQFPQEALLPQAYLHLARTYVDMKREQDAARLYEKVAEAYPNTGWAQNAQAQLRRLVRR